jgi:ParB family chromosome partitioning protein
MEISHLETSVIKPYRRNHKKHDSQQIDRIAASIKEFGFNQPIVVDEKNSVLVGHGRLLAAKQLGLKSAPVVVLKGLSESQKSAYRILDNKLNHDAEWDLESLEAELKTLADDGYDIGQWGLDEPVVPKTKTMKVAELKDHPQNYRKHPDDQLAHLVQSIKDYGIYRNVIVANDGTILSGHGVVAAARKMEMSHVPVLQLSLAPDDVRALKLLTADNEISNLGEVDDKKLSELLKEVLDSDGSLLGTGYNEIMLSGLLHLVSPMGAERVGYEEHSEGLPDYEMGVLPPKLTLSFRTVADKIAFGKLIEQDLTINTRGLWWPARESDDLDSLRFIQDDGESE